MAKTPTQIKSLARAHTDTAINVLASIMNQSSAPEAARISACTALLDRGWGKATQPLSGDSDADPIEVVTRIEIVAPDDDKKD